MTARVVLEARGLGLVYPGRDRAALDGVDLVVSAGEVVFLLGPNGSGKSTLLRLLAGILAPTSGSAKVLGDEASRLSRDEAARRVAVVSQGATVTFDLTAVEVALLGRHPFGRGTLLERPDDVARADAALVRARAGGLRDRSFRELSGGERQRVLLARALAQGTPALLLDEPTSAQDLAHGLEVGGLARALAREGRAVVVASHDLNAAARFADRVLLLREGRIDRDAAPAEALEADGLRRVFGVEALVGRAPDGVVTVVALGPG